MSTPHTRRPFWLFLSGATAQQIGMFAVPSTLIYLLFDRARESLAEAGLASMTVVLLSLVLALPIGVVLDRVRRGPALVTTALLSAVTLASFAVAGWLGQITLPHLLPAVVLVPVLWTAAQLAAQVYLPTVVERGRLTQVNAVVALAGGLAAWLLPLAFTRPDLMLALAAVAFAGCALLFRGIDVPEEPAPPRTGWWREMTEGVRFVWAHPVLKAITVYVVAAALLEPLLEELAGSRASVATGINDLAVPVGAVAALLLGRRVHPFRLAWTALLATQPFALLLAVAASGRLAVLWYGLGTFVPWAGATAAGVALLSHRQAITPPRLLGRTLAAMLLFAGLATMAASYLQVVVLGYLAEPPSDPMPPVTVQAWPVVLVCAAGLVAAAVPLYRARHLAESGRAADLMGAGA
ncbi:hypothetical protein SAMN05444920_12548 [Nonomuraea solani]|uniref:Major Facilitator Superfamily protein n=1 Tax=Nonomuraea solani TaxID=1144553 RepID=A0A1H6EYW4_9ACTN|nr:hypothetical protein [Nonomuraea solani]SEH02261.1 hypothetical protein SAMN05444920_12548 [Nonomuraea solani]